MRKFIIVLFGTCLVYFSNPTVAQFGVNQTGELYPDTPEINCNSFVPEENSDSHLEFIKKWAAFISKKMFTLPFNNTEVYLGNFKTCFSADGWQEFNRALQQSGNISLIKAKQYVSSSQVVGMVAISHQQNSNIWETNTPIQITYQNKENKVTQQLIVHLRIVKTQSNHLNVTQIVGIPQQS